MIILVGMEVISDHIGHQVYVTTQKYFFLFNPSLIDREPGLEIESHLESGLLIVRSVTQDATLVQDTVQRCDWSNFEIKIITALEPYFTCMEQLIFESESHLEF